MVASVLRFPDNLSEDKHVESELIPRLDRGSSPLSSTSMKAVQFRLYGFFINDNNQIYGYQEELTIFARFD